MPAKSDLCLGTRAQVPLISGGLNIICQDGKNKKNLEARIGKGLWIIIDQIMNMLHDVCYGPFYFEVALLGIKKHSTHKQYTNGES